MKRSINICAAEAASDFWCHNNVYKDLYPVTGQHLENKMNYFVVAFEVRTAVSMWVLVWRPFYPEDRVNAFLSDVDSRLPENNRRIILFLSYKWPPYCIFCLFSFSLLAMSCTPVILSSCPSRLSLFYSDLLVFSHFPFSNYSFCSGYSIQAPGAIGSAATLFPYSNPPPPRTFYQSHLRYSCNKPQRGAI